MFSSAFLLKAGSNGSRRQLASVVAFGAALTVALVAGSCVKVQPPTDTGYYFSPSGPSGPLPSSSSPLAYDPDMKPIFEYDCVYCHSGTKPSGNYSMVTYAGIMKNVNPGSASSRLVTTTQSRGSMVRYFSGDQQAKSALVLKWVVTYRAAQTR
jgi:hypothetical protein